MLDQQKEIECELFEIYNKNLDRFFSLIKFMFVIFGLYALTFSNVYGKLNRQAFDNVPIISIYSLLACLLFIGIALIVPFSQLVLPKERKFKQMISSIQFRKEDELKIHNKKLYLVTRRQENYYIFSFLLILLSLMFFCGYFIPFVICVSIPVFTITVLYYLTFSEWIKRENTCIKIVPSQEG
ncbi:hypothetical protein EO98_03820 [Methanosarcina sp. 2.H.T.1A.6]|nr:hypothetical protein EO97_07095 [Methanosarcina sp. 2.H.T.1A.15]KKG19041.1 hypothetical protein EO94_06460 [Methanosarcina sp. 2.H.T.1A.3]KKG20849.1 hypothetical protein EO98_03820 [Methanosarcina sp. 2.H.T.1A.6]KKG22246.1 hypothetical protein EO96_06765 [Methanosarcina sp. 2.H.T.1A.8]